MSGIHRSSTPRSAARMCHGTMLAWCSMCVSTIGVALAQVGARPRVRDEVDRLGGVAHVDDLVRVRRRAMKPATLAARGLERGGGLLRDRVDASVDVGVVLAVVAVHRVEHRERLLRRGRGVEVHEALAVHLPLRGSGSRP